MKLITQEVVKVFFQQATLALGVTAAAVGVILTLFSGVSILAEPENAADVAQMTALYTDTVYLAWIFPPILGIVLMTGEYRFSTAVQTFLQTPTRYRVLFAKMLAAMAGGATVAIASLIGAYLAAWLIGILAGEAVGPESGRFAGATVALILGGMVLSALGVAVGALIRSQLPALAVFLGWVLLVEQIVAGLLGPVGPYLPGALIPRVMALDFSAGGLASATDGILNPLSALAILAGQAVLVALIASATTLRRDID